MTGVLTGASIGLMGSLGDRLLQVMKMRGVSASKLSLDAGLSRTAAQKIIDRGGARTSADTISKLAAAGCVSREWLETGRGEIEGRQPEIEVERTEDRVPDEGETRAETALFRVMDPDRYTPGDFDAARAAMRAGPRREIPNGDLSATASRFLDAARQLRLAGEAATPTAVLWRVAVGRHPREAEVVAALDAAEAAEVAASLRAKGHEPGQGKANLDARVAAMKAKKARRES